MHGLCKQHGQRFNRCTACFKIYGHTPAGAFFTGLCPHGKRKDAGCKGCGRKQRRALCHHGNRADRCRVCQGVRAAVQKAITGTIFSLDTTSQHDNLAL